MELLDRAVEVLLNAERQLVLLANEASESRDYDGATALLEAARRVKMVGDNGITASRLPSQPPAVLANISEPDLGATQPSQRPARRPRKTEYPKFLRDGDSLIKIGWSKAEKAEYEHKSPKKVVVAVGNALTTAGSKGRRFSMDKVLPLTDPEDTSELPTYQCYLSLAWMRHEGLVVQHGRQGYSLPKNGDLTSAIERIWAQLPTRS
jgi:hypothetical protein